eukprot:SAG22_NODE_949_length_6356_cov_2.100527_2_plen_309_part_00
MHADNQILKACPHSFRPHVCEHSETTQRLSEAVHLLSCAVCRLELDRGNMTLYKQMVSTIPALRVSTHGRWPTTIRGRARSAWVLSPRCSTACSGHSVERSGAMLPSPVTMIRKAPTPPPTSCPTTASKAQSHVLRYHFLCEWVCIIIEHSNKFRLNNVFFSPGQSSRQLLLGTTRSNLASSGLVSPHPQREGGTEYSPTRSAFGRALCRGGTQLGRKQGRKRRQLGLVGGLAQSQRVQRSPRRACRVLGTRRGPELVAAKDRRRRHRPWPRARHPGCSLPGPLQGSTRGHSNHRAIYGPVPGISAHH